MRMRRAFTFSELLLVLVILALAIATSVATLQGRQTPGEPHRLTAPARKDLKSMVSSEFHSVDQVGARGQFSD
jgi:prepilin-type N-terminal cleavage/methylation domain-containing protein